MAVTYGAVSLWLWLWCCGKVALGVSWRSWRFLAFLAFFAVLNVLGEDVQKKTRTLACGCGAVALAVTCDAVALWHRGAEAIRCYGTWL